MLIKYLVLLVLWCVLAIRADDIYGRYCNAFGGEPGACMPIEECPELLEIKNSPTIPPEVKNIILRGSVCPGPDSAGTFCCAEIANAEGIRKLNQTDTCGIYNAPDAGTENESQEISMPWMALLIYEDPEKKNSPTGIKGCAGTLITEKFVLTAANCLFLNGMELKQVRLGNDGTQYVSYGIEKIIVHERYENPSQMYNIALVKLAGTVEYKGNIRPICLPFDNEVRSKAYLDKKYQTIGWGQTENFEFTNDLMMASFQRIDQFKCKYSKTILCLGDVETCVPNIGSPLMNTYTVNGLERVVQAGIANTFISRCGAGGPVAYTNLGEYIPWISRQIVK
ncbi:uncharacterized protein Dwil_GK26982 [Drosophila willistoni]|uniref:CLIP domain-containing serine protease n=1 Tax=Drosophila willistoni TaxID=7260 RepID=A0A0Q9WQN1_DROWI|nr:serine protease grass [Drosophila willistoni]KRF98265.1 uncharacterized protein Dwil_GK26982 [Drosophila willistoni]